MDIFLSRCKMIFSLMMQYGYFHLLMGFFWIFLGSYNWILSGSLLEGQFPPVLQYLIAMFMFDISSQRGEAGFWKKNCLDWERLLGSFIDKALQDFPDSAWLKEAREVFDAPSLKEKK